MSGLSIEWLPIGHITHGYRRVFIVREEDRVRNVVALAPMPYEVVFQVQQATTAERITDPSLWWGLSSVVELIQNGTLDIKQNPDLADDGYLLHRPTYLGPEHLIPLDSLKVALRDGRLSL